MTLLKQGVANDTIHSLMNYDFEDRANKVSQLTDLKWEARTRNEIFCYETLDRDKQTECSTPVSRMVLPKDMQEILNVMMALCSACKVRCTHKHMQESHLIYIPTFGTMINQYS